MFTPEQAEIRSRMMRRLYDVLRERGDKFSPWMTSVYHVGEVGHDPALSGLDASTYRK